MSLEAEGGPPAPRVPPLASRRHVPTTAGHGEEGKAKLVGASLTNLIPLCVEQGVGAGRTLPADITRTQLWAQLCSADNFCFPGSSGGAGHGEGVRAHGCARRCGLVCKAPGRASIKSSTDLGCSKPGHRGLWWGPYVHGVCIRGQVYEQRRGRYVRGGAGGGRCPHCLSARLFLPRRVVALGRTRRVAAGSVLALQRLPRALPGQRTAELRGARMSFVPAICPCCHKMGTSGRGALSGPGRGCRGPSLGPACGAELEPPGRQPWWASSQPQVQSTLGTLVPARRGAGALPRSPCPALGAPTARHPMCPCPSTQPWGPFTRHPSVAAAGTQPTRGVRHTDSSFLQLGSPSANVPAPLPRDLQAAWQQWPGAKQVQYLPHCWPRSVLQLVLPQPWC